MIKVALVDQATGVVSTVVTPADDNLYEDRATYGGLIAIHVSYEVDANEVLSNWLWTGDEWITRPERPGAHYIWLDGEWSFHSESFWQEIRDKRNYLLSASDWSQIADSPLTNAQVEDYKVYRQALRDLPTTYASAVTIEEVVFPEI